MNITILHYNHCARGDYRILDLIAKLSDICFSCLAKFSSGFSHSSLKIILKQLFTSGSVNIAEYLPRLRLGKYSAIFTSPSANNS